MKQIDFQQLSIDEQVDTLYREGVYIGKRKHPYGTVLLYQLDSWYAEVEYIRYRHWVTCITTTASTTVLDPYLKEINLEQLVLLL